MDKYTATEEAYKHGYEKGYEAGKRDATDNKVGCKTNADRIRAMSDEELAREFAAIAVWGRRNYARVKPIGMEKVMRDWLHLSVEAK
jgi:hypothetical protein